jgi:putative ABC transport system substrate-binding protein
MRRREFVTLIGVAATLPFAARAQDAGRTYRLGSLHINLRNSPHHVALFDELRRLGFVDGQNLVVDTQGYGLRVEQLAEHASELVNARVDVIICGGTAAIRAAQQATKTIPILATTNDMIGSGLVHSLAKPDGNTTGISLLATELDGKRQEILIEATPGIRRMAALAEANTNSTQRLQMLQEAARTRGVELSVYQVGIPGEIEGAMNTAKSSNAEALNVMASPFLYRNRQIILENAAKLRLPAVYEFPEIAEEGGFIAYGSRLTDLYRSVVARQLVALLRGAQVAGVPIEQATRFELVLNLKTAKALGLIVPESFLVRADKVVE